MRFVRSAEPYLLALFVVAACFWGCGDDDPEDIVGFDDTEFDDSVAVPDFSLRDHNPNSATYNQQVSPRDYIGRLSAWYFGSAT